MERGQPIVWIVLFESVPPPEDYKPTVSYFPPTPFMHLFDPEMVPALQPIWWCLHLPNDYAQCFDLNAAELVALEELDLHHRIILIPLGVLRSKGVESLVIPNVALVVSPDNATGEVQEYSGQWNPAFGIVPYSGLTQEALDKYWENVAKIIGDRGIRHLAPPLMDLSTWGAESISLLHRLRQLKPPSERPDNQTNCTQSELIKRALWTSLHVRTLASLENSKCPPEDFVTRYDTEIRATRPSWHLSIGAAGAPSTARKLAASKDNLPPPSLLSASFEDEQRVLDILIAHRAIARGGFGMRLPDVPAEAFASLRDLEQSMRSIRVNERKTQTALERIGKSLGGALTEEQCAAILASRTITAFTDFPWGLAVLPGDSSSLSTRIPITYRPLTPLSRALQHELTPPPPSYWGNGFSVLIVECLEQTDRLRSFSERGWRHQVQQLVKLGEGKVKCRFEVIECVTDLYRLLDESSYDALIVSAHGISSGRLSGLRIGKDDVFDFEHTLPPVVVLSACEVWPRGTGIISIADLALRWGTSTVLGTLVPINASHQPICGDTHLSLRD